MKEQILQQFLTNRLIGFQIRDTFKGREGKQQLLYRCYVPSRTRKVDSTSLMSTLPSLASFRASTARWAPPSLAKRMRPYKERDTR